MGKDINNYRLFYKLEEGNWRYFFFVAKTDEEARRYADRWASKVGTVLYGVKKVVKEVLI